MSIQVGKSYHIKDEFFELVKDDKLMANKESGNYRPHFFFVADPKVNGIYWAIPLSSKVEKYTELMKQKIARYGRCNTIVIGTYGKTDGVFLIQNMFPVIEKYVEHEHLIGGVSVNIHHALAEIIRRNADEVLIVQSKGHKLIFPDIDRIYKIMLSELNASGKEN